MLIPKDLLLPFFPPKSRFLLTFLIDFSQFFNLGSASRGDVS